MITDQTEVISLGSSQLSQLTTNDVLSRGWGSGTTYPMITGVRLRLGEDFPINDLAFLDMFPNIVWLSVLGLVGLQGDERFILENIMNFPRIRHIFLYGPSLETLNGLEFCSELEKLDISLFVPRDIDITAIQGLPNLKTLSLSRYCQVKTHTLDLSDCTSLSELKISCDNLTTDLRFIRGNKLSRLIVCGCLKTLDGLDVEDLVYLKIRSDSETPHPLNIESLLKAHKLKDLIIVEIELENPSILDQLKDVNIDYRK